MAARQLNFDFFDECTGSHPTLVDDAIEQLAEGGGLETRGAIFTRPEVVDFILNLAEYTEDKPLHEKRLLEPSFGGGDFLLAVVRRLLKAWRAAKGSAGSALDDMGNAIRAVELHRETFHATYAAVVDLLKREGLKEEVTNEKHGQIKIFTYVASFGKGNPHELFSRIDLDASNKSCRFFKFKDCFCVRS